MQQAARRKRGRAGVFHSAQAELIHRRLVIFVPRVGHAEPVGEEAQHLRSTRKRWLDAVRLTVRDTIVHGNVAPGFLALIELARHQRNQIGGDRLRLPPGPRLHPRPGVDNALELAVRDGDPVARHRDDHLCGRAVVRVIVNGDVVAGVFGFALRPNFLGLRRVALVRENEIQTLLGASLVPNHHLMLLAAFARPVEIDMQFGVVGREVRILAVEPGAEDRQSNGIEVQLAQAVLQWGDGVRHLADYLMLIQIEPQFDARVLQVIIATAGKGFIGAKPQREPPRLERARKSK